MNKINWTVVIVVGAVVLLVLMLGAGLFGGMMGCGGYHYGGWGMMGPWMTAGFFLMWLMPVAFLVLCVLAIAWGIRAIGGGGRQSPSSRDCPNCGRGVQPDWTNCPYCGTQLTK